MRTKLLTIIGVLLLIVTVACANTTPFLWSSMVLADSPPSDSSNIMIVFHKIADGMYLFWCDLSATITDNGDGTWDVDSPQVKATGVKQANVDYDYYQYQEISPEYDDNGDPIPIYMADLNLQPVTGTDLPQSRHVAVLKDVYMDNGKPRANVWRMWHGVAYELTNCRVSQTAYDQYQAGLIQLYNPAYDWLAPENAESFVAVDYIHENFTGTDVTLVFVDGKLIK